MEPPLRTDDGFLLGWLSTTDMSPIAADYVPDYSHLYHRQLPLSGLGPRLGQEYGFPRDDTIPAVHSIAVCVSDGTERKISNTRNSVQCEIQLYIYLK